MSWVFGYQCALLFATVSLFFISAEALSWVSLKPTPSDSRSHFLTPKTEALFTKRSLIPTLWIWCACKQSKANVRCFIQLSFFCLKSIAAQSQQNKSKNTARWTDSALRLDRLKYCWSLYTSKLTVRNFTYPISCWFITGNVVILLCKWKRMR